MHVTQAESLHNVTLDTNIARV